MAITGVFDEGARITLNRWKRDLLTTAHYPAFNATCVRSSNFRRVTLILLGPRK